MTDSLFAATPTSVNADDGLAINTGTTFRVTSAVTCTHHRFYAPTSGAGTVTARLYELTDETTGTLLAEKVYAAVTGGAYNTQAWDTPVNLVTGKAYRTQHHASGGHYVATGSVFTAPVTSAGGLLVAIQNGTDPVGIGTLRNGNFKYNAAPTLCDQNGNNTNFFDDVVVSVGAANVSGTGAGLLGGIVGAAIGVHSGFGVAAGLLGGLVGAAAGVVVHNVSGTATGVFGGLVGAATGNNVTAVDHAPSPGDGWYDLLAIRTEMREVAAAEAVRPRVACATCGTPLLSGPRGERYCPFDGRRY